MEESFLGFSICETKIVGVTGLQESPLYEACFQQDSPYHLKTNGLLIKFIYHTISPFIYY